MSYSDIYRAGDTSVWKAFTADGRTESPALQAAEVAGPAIEGSEAKSLQLTLARSNPALIAANPFAERPWPAGLDLSRYEEIRLWLRCNRLADGTSDQPFFLKLVLTYTQTGRPDPRTWYRYLPVARSESWQLVRLSLDDLKSIDPPATPQAIRLVCAEAGQPFECFIARLLLVKEEMINDADDAFLSRLPPQVDGIAVPAHIFLPWNKSEPGLPYIRVYQYDLRFVPEFTSLNRARTDFVDGGYRLRPVREAYHLCYEVAAYADNRPQQARILEAILQALPPSGDLSINGATVPIQRVPAEAIDKEGKRISDWAVLRYMVLTGQEIGAPEPITVPYRSVTIGADQQALGPSVEARHGPASETVAAGGSPTLR